MSTLQTAKEVAGRMANDILEHQVNKLSPLFRKMNKDAEKCKGRTHRIHVSNGLPGGTSLVADNGTLPTRSNLSLETIDVAPEAFVSRITVGFIAASLADGAGDGLDLLAENAAAAGEEISYYIGRSLMDGYISGITVGGSISAGSVTATLADVGGVRVGAVYEEDASGDEFTVSSVTRTAGAAGGSVTFSTSASGTLSGSLSLRGESATNFVSLADASGSGNIYSTAISSARWQGVQVSAGGALTDSILLDLDSRIADETQNPVSAFVMSPANWREVMQGRGGNRRFVNPTGEDDLYGDYMAKPQVAGKEVVVDPQCPNTKAFAYCADKVKLGRWHDPETGDGFIDYRNAGSRGFDVDNTNFAQVSAKAALMQLLVRNRNCVGQVDGITVS